MDFEGIEMEKNAKRKLEMSLTPLVLTIGLAIIIFKVGSAQYSYEVYIVNQRHHSVEIVQVCINSSTCSSGKLEPKQSIWLTKQTHLPENRLTVTIQTKNGKTNFGSCEISKPKPHCAYEILIQDDGSIVASLDRNDCINF